MKLISIDIGSDYLVALQGEYNRNNVIIKTATKKTLKSDCVVDGKIKDKNAVKDMLNNILKSNKFTTKKAVVTVGVENALTREFIVPKGTHKQISSMVANEMKMAYMANATDVIQYKQIKELTEKTDDKKLANKSCNVRALALQRDDVEACHEILAVNSLKSTAMDVHFNSLEKLFALKPRVNNKDLSNKGYMLLDISYSGAYVYIFSGYNMVASRFIPIGISDIVDAMGFNFLDDGKDVHEYLDDIDLSDDNAKPSPNMDMVLSVMAQCNNELQKVILYNISKLPQSTLSHIFVYGTGSKMKGIEKNISTALNTNAEIIYSVSSVKFKNEEQSQDIAQYLNAAGSLIRLN